MRKPPYVAIGIVAEADNHWLLYQLPVANVETMDDDYRNCERWCTGNEWNIPMVKSEVVAGD